ncbi:MAG TPA: zf-TFIIB domain-containing protein [Gemmatimonadales bacterium]|jgi:Zn-finger nucleic acid-binding protein|nr:zf-TFIIB domain-containing protein [Gemmatimonadales bacterium]
MTHHKPRQNEDEYFARLDAEKIEKARRTSSEMAAVTERATHFGRCPKCGGHLVSEEFHMVTVGRCPDCHGLWLEAGEIDAVVAHEDHSLLRRVVDDALTIFRRDVKNKGKKGE